MLVTMMLLAMAPNPTVLDAPRKAYSVCIKGFETKSLAAKMDPAAYATALKGQCSAEADSLARALTSYDVAMGGKRATAAASAASDVADYRLTSEERFRDLTPSAPAMATATPAPPVTVASAPK
ncbi:MAG: hypothetical protein M3Q88_03520 [Pseudomonadota bacterium]|nr:hypothetical protein [Pseudomonadota bacterium]